jgi:hypothetical protein
MSRTQRDSPGPGSGPRLGIVHLTLTSPVKQRAMAMIGFWDPLLPGHESMLQELVAAARASAHSPVALLLDPSPAALIRGLAAWPVHLAIEARIELLLDMGLESVGVVRMARADLDAGGADLLLLVEPALILDDLWLGTGQRLGSRDAGSTETVDRLLADRGIRLRRLPDSDLPDVGAEVRRQLSLGRPAAAAVLAGRPAVLARQADSMIRTAWPVGDYRAWAAEDLTPAPPTVETATAVQFQLDPDPNGGRRGEWPGPARWLIVVSGPGDRDTNA